MTRRGQRWDWELRRGKQLLAGGRTATRARALEQLRAAARQLDHRRFVSAHVIAHQPTLRAPGRVARLSVEEQIRLADLLADGEDTPPSR